MSLMKRLQVSIAMCLLGVGGVMADSPPDKNPLIEDASCPCLFPGLHVGAFASGLLPRGKGGENAMGGGIAFTYFFTEKVALEYSYSANATDPQTHINALDLVYRLPLQSLCWSPYVMGGGAVFSNAQNEGAYRLGGGLEYRFENCVALFSDATYNWIQREPDAVNLRLGLRLPF